jgi:hypothetical protein
MPRRIIAEERKWLNSESARIVVFLVPFMYIGTAFLSVNYIGMSMSGFLKNQLMVHISFLTYQGDMGRYVQSQVYLKALAEECAAGAALYYEEEEFAEGRMVFDYEEGHKYVDYLLNKTTENMPLPKSSRITYTIHFEDDLQGYEEGLTEYEENNPGHHRFGSDIKNPSVTVKLTADTGDLFRLAFLKIDQVTRTAKYELPHASNPIM